LIDFKKYERGKVDNVNIVLAKCLDRDEVITLGADDVFVVDGNKLFNFVYNYKHGKKMLQVYTIEELEDLEDEFSSFFVAWRVVEMEV